MNNNNLNVEVYAIYLVYNSARSDASTNALHTITQTHRILQNASGIQTGP